MTESEAKTKWCPMFRAVIAVGPSDGNEYVTNRDDVTGSNGSRCIGSACMAWRVQSGWSKDAMTGQNGPIDLGGYCGLAGKP